MLKQAKTTKTLELSRVPYLFFVVATSSGATPAWAVVAASAATGLYSRLILPALSACTSSIHSWIRRTATLTATVLRCVAYKSFTTLINTSYSMKNYGQTSESSMDSGTLSKPLSFLRSGYYLWTNASLSYRGSNGDFWSLHSTDTVLSGYLDFYATYLNPRRGDSHGIGFAVRCLGFF